MNNAEVVPTTKKHRRVLRALFELYAHDFSPMTGADVNAGGMYTEDDFLTGWWDAHADEFHPFLLKIGGQWAGFAWVEVGSYVAPGQARHWLMEEFFILRKYRGRGVGEWFARQLFARFPGTWEVGEIHANTDAQRFWRTVIGRYAGEFEDIVVDNDRWEGPVQRFAILD
jgi:predicted acetyltransferase